MNTDNLENQLLVAMPGLEDPYFANTVTYMWKHGPEGALGLVINKPLSARLKDIFAELDIDVPQPETALQEQHVMAGGPVERDKGFILHDSDEAWDSSIAITDGISLCTSRTILQSIARGDGPGNFLVALGCAGWEAGQLEKEISENAWLTTPASSDLVFSRDYESMASEAAAQLGIDLTSLTSIAGHS
jgi:putative transcriptional regulator